MTDDTVDITDVSPSTLVGRRVAKRFRIGIFIGTITETWIDDDNFDQYWCVVFDDTDVHDLNLTELTTALQLYKLYPTEYRFPSDNQPIPISTSKVNHSISSNFRGAPSLRQSLIQLFPISGEPKNPKSHLQPSHAPASVLVSLCSYLLLFSNLLHLFPPP